MRFLTAVYTDAGTRKNVNQDSMLVMQADSAQGNILLASVCDGMGGFAKGEEASAMMVQALVSWFENDLPELLAEGFRKEVLWSQWNSLIETAGKRIADYAAKLHASAGTTATAILIIGRDYYILNVGDSRVYLITDQTWQLTMDQTYVQREIDAGRMTVQQAMTDPQRNALLQCVGASPVVVPDFSYGTIRENEVYMLCSDGFRHCVSPQEMHQAFAPETLTDRTVMEANMKKLTELCIARGEEDNISCVLIKTF